MYTKRRINVIIIDMEKESVPTGFVGSPVVMMLGKKGPKLQFGSPSYYPHNE